MPKHDNVTDPQPKTKTKTKTKTRQKACNACIKGKRRCDLHHPSCRRCVVKGIECVYASTRLHERSSRLRGCTGTGTGQLVDGKNTPIHALSVCRRVVGNHHDDDDNKNKQGSSTLCQSSNLYFDDGGHLFDNGINVISTGISHHHHHHHRSMLFFLVPDTWTVKKNEPSNGGTANAAAAASSRAKSTPTQLNKSMLQIQNWVKQWVEEGSNMFVHRRLYSPSERGGDNGGETTLRMPRCIQDAYTTCAAYFGARKETREMILRIVEDRVSTLLKEEGDEDGDNDPIEEVFDDDKPEAEGEEEIDPHISPQLNGDARRSKPRSVLDHLARVQALLAYQIIRLFDGDARSRLMAELLIPVLSRWCDQMVESALISSQYLQQQHSITSTATTTSSSRASIEKQITVDWNAWILAESVRRTWLVAGHMQCIYQLLSLGVSVCPGGIMFTTRAGLWQADSAFEWWAKFREKDALFCLSLDSGRYLLTPGKTNPDDVDDFGKFVLRIIEGEEKVDKWMAASQRRS